MSVRRIMLSAVGILYFCIVARAGPVMLTDFALPDAVGGADLLASFDDIVGSGVIGLSDARAQLGIGIFSNINRTGLAQTGAILYPNEFLRDGGNGAFDLSFDSHGADFRVLAELVTNGVDDSLGLFVVWPERGPLLVAAGPESLYFGHERGTGEFAPDLAGFRLDLIRLHVRDLSIAPFRAGDTRGLTAECDFAFDFYGSPIPEPGSLLLLIVGATTALVRRRCVDFSLEN